MFPSDLVGLIPVFGGVVTIIAVGLKIGRLLQKIDTAIEDIESIKKICMRLRTDWAKWISV